MRKSLAFLSVFMLLLNMYPCSDDLFACEETTEYIEADQNSRQDIPEEDDCTSFCSCACCKVPLIGIDQNLETQEIQDTRISSKNHQTHAYPLVRKIWQPPRV